MRVCSALIAPLVAATALACGGPVSDPTDNAERALEDANISGVDVQWDDEARIAHLTGSVESTDHRTRAEDVATSAVGTSGRVLNELTVKGVDDDVADNLDGQIRSTLADMIEKDQTLRDRDVNFDVTNGVVTVKGEVRSAAEKTKVTELLRAAPGVKDFANALEIARD